VARSPATDSAALISAAAAVFKSKGYHNATIDDIADAAGVSRPTVYKYTQNKRALLDSMLDAVLDAITALWVPKTYATWADALRGAGQFHTVSGGWKAGQRGGMIFGLWA